MRKKHLLLMLLLSITPFARGCGETFGFPVPAMSRIIAPGDIARMWQNLVSALGSLETLAIIIANALFAILMARLASRHAGRLKWIAYVMASLAIGILMVWAMIAIIQADIYTDEPKTFPALAVQTFGNTFSLVYYAVPIKASQSLADMNPWKPKSAGRFGVHDPVRDCLEDACNRIWFVLVTFAFGFILYGLSGIFRRRKPLGPCVLISAAVTALWCGDCHAYLDIMHRTVAREAADLIKASDTAKEYEELYSHSPYQEPLYDGARDQDYGSVDGNQRGMRHYFDPDAPEGKQGCPYSSYFELWEIYGKLVGGTKDTFGIYWDKNEMIEATEPPGGYYDGALEWARTSGGFKDINNWRNAISAYDYTESSRKEAYRRLGHVIHLLGDCAEPDHAYNVPHPGSDRADVNFSSELCYGYERFCDSDSFKVSLMPEKVDRRTGFDGYFIDLAHLAKARQKESGLPVPLGLQKHLIEAGPVKAIEVAWTPTINVLDPDGISRYTSLARSVLSPAAEMAAGLMEDYYDIVNRPPYVLQVTIEQQGVPKYRGSWTDNLREKVDMEGAIERRYYYVDSRQLARIGSELKANTEAQITVEFGPSGVPVPEKIDKESVKVVVDDKEVPGAIVDDLTWRGSFTIALKEAERRRDIKIRIYAKDAHNHFPRQNLPARGYELDNFPGGPARVDWMSDDWVGYEPGWDENHYATVAQELPPPIVSRLEVFSQDTYFIKASWEKSADGTSAVLIDEPEVERAGVNSATTTDGTVRITFDREVDPETVKAALAGFSIPLNRLNETTYEGRIPFSRFGKEGVDDVFTFEIEAKDMYGKSLDGRPGTVAYPDLTTDRWMFYEESPDASHAIRIYYQPTTRPAFTGYVYTIDPQKNVPESLIYDFGVAHRYGWAPVTGKPVANAQVLIAMSYAQVKDKELFSRFYRLLRTRMAIERKIRAGARKITQAEYRDCLEFLDIQNDYAAALTVTSGSLPGFITTTDANGRFRFELDRFLYKDGITILKLNAFAIPETGKPTRLEMSNTVWYDYVPVEYELIKRYPRSAPTDAFLRAEGSLKAARSTLREASDALEAARAKLEELKAQWVRPRELEKRWQDRALKQQRELEKNFIQDNGPAIDWGENIRKDFEAELAAIPDEARKAWEKEAKEFEDKKNEALKKGEEGLAGASRSFAEARKRAAGLDEEYRKLLDDASKDRIDVMIGMRERPEGERAGTYQFGETVTGTSFQPQFKTGYAARVYLVKQVLDESENPPREPQGMYGSDYSVHVRKDDEDAPRPPYTFTFESPLKEHRALYHFDELFLEKDDFTVGPVSTVFDKEFGIYFQRTALFLYSLLSLPSALEVEGFPIADRELFDELWKEYEQLEEELVRINGEVITLTRDFYSGNDLDNNAFARQRFALYDKSANVQKRRMELIKEFYNINPAFSPEAVRKVFGRDVRMPTGMNMIP